MLFSCTFLNGNFYFASNVKIRRIMSLLGNTFVREWNRQKLRAQTEVSDGCVTAGKWPGGKLKVEHNGRGVSYLATEHSNTVSLQLFVFSLFHGILANHTTFNKTM